MIFFRLSTHIVNIEPPIWQNPDSNFAYFSINATRKFSREFDAYLPMQQSLVRIYARNSLENFLTILNFKACEIVSFDLLVPYVAIKKLVHLQIIRQIYVG